MIPLRFLGAAVLCTSSLAFTLNDTTTKFLISDYDVSSIILIRSLMALPILYLFHVRTTGRSKIWSARIGLHALRGAFGLIAAYLYIASLKTLTVAEATVILFMTPVIITAMSRFLRKESQLSHMAVDLFLFPWRGCGDQSTGIQLQLRYGASWYIERVLRHQCDQFALDSVRR